MTPIGTLKDRKQQSVFSLDVGIQDSSAARFLHSHRHATEYRDSSVPRLATHGNILRRASHVQRSNVPADGLRSISVMSPCAYFRAAELTVYGFSRIYFNHLRSCFSFVSAPENDLIRRGAKGCSRPLVPRIMLRDCSFPPLN